MKKGLTFKTLIGFDDIQKEFELVIDEHREMIKLIMGDNYGIVSSVSTSSSDSTLYPVYSNGTLSVTEGKIVTKNGYIASLSEFTKEIPSFSSDLAIIYLYEMIGSSEKRITNNGNVASVWFERKTESESILLVNASDYYNLSDEVRRNSICICVLKYQEDNDPIVDLTNSSYDFNRPWFSPTDIAHRKEVGTGDSSVPHSIGLNDLSSSNMTLYSQLVSRGIIVSKDIDVAGVSGTSYEDNGVVEEDENGNKIVKLTAYPNALGYAIDSDGNDIEVELISGDNKLYIKDTKVNEGDKLKYNLIITETLMPPSPDTFLEELTFKEANSNDICITQGLQTSINDYSISFANCGTIKRNFEVVLASDGYLHKEPEILGYSSQVATFTEIKTYNQEFEIPVYVEIAIEDAIIQNDSTATFIVNGYNGTESISEEVSFTLEEYSEETDYLSINKKTSNIFTKVTSIQASTNDLNSGAKCTIYACAKRALDTRLKIASVIWDGNKIDSIKDIRPISTTIKDPIDVDINREIGKSILTSLYINRISQNLSTYKLIVVEDFRNVSHLDTKSVNWKITPYGINFPIIPSSIIDCRNYSDCYRSRIFQVTSSETMYALVLIGGNDETNESLYSVRLCTTNNTGYNEYNMIPVSEGLFLINFASNSPDYMQIVISGRASGFILMRLDGSTNTEDKYKV